MRLLNTSTLQFKEFCYDGCTPPYAILSHCWSDSEVSLVDIEQGRTDVASTSWKKLLSFCGRARSDSHEYVWIDTCCIDKSSSAELSEAINSMFEWYQNASKCYVYLEDVEHDGLHSSTMGTSIEDAFQRSRWFTRGWTLQELIAPREVHFFDRSWESIGERSQLKHLLHKVTGISEAILDRTSYVIKVNLFTKIAWVKNRATTRSEDLAYSLLGIFDVNMLPIYGEGIKALFRLQEEILRNTWPSAIGSAASRIVLQIRELFNNGRLRPSAEDEETDVSCIWSEFSRVLGHYDFSNGLRCHEDILPYNARLLKSMLVAEIMEYSDGLCEDPMSTICHMLKSKHRMAEGCLEGKNSKKHCGMCPSHQHHAGSGKLRRLHSHVPQPTWVPQYTTTNSQPKTEFEAFPFDPTLPELPTYDLIDPTIDNSLGSSPETHTEYQAGHWQPEQPVIECGERSSRAGRVGGPRYVCSHCTKSFSRLRDRDRHIADIHVQTGIYYMCGTCNYGSKRKDKVLAHCRRMHGHDMFNLTDITNHYEAQTCIKSQQPIQYQSEMTDRSLGTNLITSSDIRMETSLSPNITLNEIDFEAHAMLNWDDLTLQVQS